MSRDVEEAPQCLADDLARRRVILFGARFDRFLQFGIKADGHNLGGRSAQHRSTASTSLQHLDVVATLGLIGQRLDVGVSPHLAGLGRLVSTTIRVLRR